MAYLLELHPPELNDLCKAMKCRKNRKSLNKMSISRYSILLYNYLSEIASCRKQTRL